MAETAIDFLLESLNQLGKGSIDCPFSLVEMNQRDSICKELQFLTNFVKKSDKYRDDREGLEDLVRKRKLRDEHEEVKDLVRQIRDVAYEAADSIDLSLVNHMKRSPNDNNGSMLFFQTLHEDFNRRRVLSDVLKQITAIKIQVMLPNNRTRINICAAPKRGSVKAAIARNFLSKYRPLLVKEENVEEEIVVGIDHEVEMLKDRLITGIQNQLEVVSIVGMAGSGKTTLARKLYNDPFILYHFYIRGWTSVSQVYRKRDLLLNILSSVVGHKKTEIHTLTDEQLGQELYRRLKCGRYLVIMDDMWDVGAWNDLKIYFPNDTNGSRILFTSRHTAVAFQANHNAPPHHIPFLKEDDSWDLLEKKIFRKKSCPPQLMDIGKQIAKKCQGLPLAIVVVAGLLAKTDKNQDSWKQVAGSLSSYVVSDTRQCMNILGLSYNSLPHHLRLCFLYFSAFPEDYEISVRKLIWLWIAEGFIHRIRCRSLEDVAENYLMDLINRNLVLVAKRRSTGGIKACRVHDLLHDFCLRKAEEENFLHQIYKDGIRARPGYDHHLSSSSSLVTIRKKYRRLCVNSYIFNYIPSEPSAPHIRSFLCFVSERSSSPLKSMSFNYLTFILLRVLDLSDISILTFPSEIVELILLRYLALQGKHLTIPSSIGNLWNLEVLIISHGEISVIPNELWNILTLRHLRIAGKNYIVDQGEYSFVLYNLQTISHITPTRPCQDLLARTPNLRKLGFCGSFNSIDYVNFWFPDLDFLNCLETLKLSNVFVPCHHTYNLQGVKFPPNLKRLTLSNTALEWKEMSVIGMLPNLEVLKLEFQACIGSLWETRDGGFHRLKYLRMYHTDLEQWNTSSIHFPSLQHLVLHNCHKLKEIPSELGDICTLHTIEVRSCSDSAVNSAREIQKEQEEIGNDSLKIITINSPDWELEPYSQVCVEQC